MSIRFLLERAIERGGALLVGVLLGVGPDLRAVAADRRQTKRRENQIEIGDRPAADERDGAVGPLSDKRERSQQRFGHMDGVRRRRDVEDRAVDIEQNGEIAKIEGVQWHAGISNHVGIQINFDASGAPQCLRTRQSRLWGNLPTE